VPACPGVVRGQHFPSIKDAARAMGVTPECAHRHLTRYGHLDLLGLPRGGWQSHQRRKVAIFGRTFESVSAAAAALRVDRKTIRNMQHSTAARETVLRALMLAER